MADGVASTSMDVDTTDQKGRQEKRVDEEESHKQNSSWITTLKLWDTREQVRQQKRHACAKCGRNKQYFCYDCFTLVGDAALIPQLSLPIKCDVIHHPSEKKSKSTAVHARILAPNDVRILEFPFEVPDYNVEETVLLFPGDDSVGIDEMSEEDFKKVKKVVFIDSQWHKAKSIFAHENIRKLKCVKIKSYKTLFWRYQYEDEHFLATIEAIYYFYKEYAGKTYQGEYDNLLYYYVLMYELIQKKYRENRDITFRRKRDYIQYDEEEERVSQPSKKEKKE